MIFIIQIIIFLILLIILNLHYPSLSGLAATLDPIALDVGLTARSCYESVTTK
jgi:hypothetical protein